MFSFAQRRLSSVLVIAGVVLLVGAAPACATTRIWDGGGANTNWNTFENWDNDAPPGPGDDVQIPAEVNGGPVVITGIPSGANSFANFVVEQTSGGQVPQSLTGQSGATIATSSNLTLHGGTYTSVGFQADAGSVVLSAGASASPVSFTGGIIGFNQFLSSIDLNDAAIQLGSGAVLRTYRELLTDPGTPVTITGSGTFSHSRGDIDGGLTTAAGITTQLGSSTAVVIGDDASIAGSLRINSTTASSVSFEGEESHFDQAAISMLAGARLALSGEVTTAGDVPLVISKLTGTTATDLELRGGTYGGLTVGSGINTDIWQAAADFEGSTDFGGDVDVRSTVDFLDEDNTFRGNFAVNGGSGSTVHAGASFEDMEFNDGSVSIGGAGTTVGGVVTNTENDVANFAAGVHFGSTADGEDAAINVTNGRLRIADADVDAAVNLTGAGVLSASGDPSTFSRAVSATGTSQLRAEVATIEGHLTVGNGAVVESAQAITFGKDATVALAGTLRSRTDMGNTFGGYRNHGAIDISTGGGIDAQSTIGIAFRNEPDGSIDVDPGAGNATTLRGGAVGAPFINDGVIELRTGDVLGNYFRQGDAGVTRFHVTGDGNEAGVHYAHLITAGAELDGRLETVVDDGVAAPALDDSLDLVYFTTLTDNGYSVVNTRLDTNGAYLAFTGASANNLSVGARRAAAAPTAASAHVGDAVSFAGTGFLPDETVAVALTGGGSDVALGNLVATDGGVLAGSLAVPSGVAPGAYAVQFDGARSLARLSSALTATAKPVPVVQTPITDKTGGGGTTPPITTILMPLTFVGVGRKNDKVTGTKLNDVIRTGAGNDVANGGAGNDVIDGGAGNDKLTGGPGKDRLLGSTGNDTIVAKDGAIDTIACGPGKDVVSADKRDKVAKDCEKVLRK